MADEPKLVFDLVFAHLSYEDLQALRCTCKGMKEFIDEKQFTKLHLFVRKYSYHHRLFYTDETIGYPHSLHSENLTILSSTKFREQFAHLQKMIICSSITWGCRDIDKTPLDLDCLNYFSAISHLEIDQFRSIKGELNLQELRIAALQTTGLGLVNLPVKLNCPRLRVLKVHWIRPILTSETNELDYLHYSDYDESINYLESICPNLQKLSTICIEATGCLLELLSKLKIGVLSLDSLRRIRLEQCKQFGRLDELAYSLEDLRSDLSTKRVTFTFNGRPIHSPDELRQIARLIRAHDSEVAKEDRLNLRCLGDRSLLYLNGTAELDFLLSAVRQVRFYEETEMSEELIRKLKDVEHLHFGRQCKPSFSTFELFAKTCQSLRLLALHHQTLTERLLKMLSKHLVNLDHIRIAQCEYETLKPLAKFRNLEFVFFDFDPPRDELTFIYENSRTLKMVQIHGLVEISLLNDGTVHQIMLHNKNGSRSQRFEFGTLSAMIDHYQVAKHKWFKQPENYKGSARLSPMSA